MKEHETKSIVEVSIDQIYEILKKPINTVLRHNNNIEIISDLAWKEYLKRGTYNLFRMQFDDQRYQIHIRAVNSRYRFRQNDIIIQLIALDNKTTKMTIRYITKTTFLLNKILDKLLGYKIDHFSDESIIKNINKIIKHTPIS